MVKLIERGAPLGGIIFVLLMLVGAVFVTDVPRSDAAESEIASYLTDGENHTRNIIGSYMWVLGGLAFLWFQTGLRSVLRGAEKGAGTLSNLAFGAGVAFVAVWMTSAVCLAAIAYAIEVRDASGIDPNLVRVIPAMGGLLLLLGGGFATILVLLATAAVVFQTGVLPRWLGWLGILIAIIQLFDIVYGNIVPFLVWAVAASVVLLMHEGNRTGITEPSSLPHGFEKQAVQP